MPSGKVHAQCSLALSVPAFGLGYLLTGNLTCGLACGVGCLLGIPLTPDLDQEGLSHSEYEIVKWTFGLGFVWLMLWYPYARAFKHRSVGSHFPILSTAIRLAYLGILVGIAAWFGLKLPRNIPWPLVGWAVAGLVLSDTAHWVLDSFYSEAGRRHARR